MQTLYEKCKFNFVFKFNTFGLGISFIPCPFKMINDIKIIMYFTLIIPSLNHNVMVMDVISGFLDILSFIQCRYLLTWINEMHIKMRNDFLIYFATCNSNRILWIGNMSRTLWCSGKCVTSIQSFLFHRKGTLLFSIV